MKWPDNFSSQIAMIRDNWPWEINYSYWILFNEILWLKGYDEKLVSKSFTISCKVYFNHYTVPISNGNANWHIFNSKHFKMANAIVKMFNFRLPQGMK